MEAMASAYDPDHFYYNHLGEPITIEEWARLREQDCVLQQHRISLSGVVPAVLKTVYLGFVFPDIHDARLFGTALIMPPGKVIQLEVHDSEEQALLRHMTHLDAIGNGFHCARCREGLRHID